MKKIFISACLMGQKVRYDGDHQTVQHDVLQKWQQQGRIFTLCPEVAGGLPVPRTPAEITQDSGIVYDQNGINVSEAFQRGARAALAICLQHKIGYALLKESSPSCGTNTIYDGCFSGKKIAGHGVTAQLLKAHSILVFSERQLAALIAHIDD